MHPGVGVHVHMPEPMHGTRVCVEAYTAVWCFMFCSQKNRGDLQYQPEHGKRLQPRTGTYLQAPWTL